MVYFHNHSSHLSYYLPVFQYKDNILPVQIILILKIRWCPEFVSFQLNGNAYKGEKSLFQNKAQMPLYHYKDSDWKE